MVMLNDRSMKLRTRIQVSTEVKNAWII